MTTNKKREAALKLWEQRQTPEDRARRAAIAARRAKEIQSNIEEQMRHPRETLPQKPLPPVLKTGDTVYVKDEDHPNGTLYPATFKKLGSSMMAVLEHNGYEFFVRYTEVYREGEMV